MEVSLTCSMWGCVEGLGNEPTMVTMVSRSVGQRPVQNQVLLAWCWLNAGCAELVCPGLS